MMRAYRTPGFISLSQVNFVYATHVALNTKRPADQNDRSFYLEASPLEL